MNPPGSSNCECDPGWTDDTCSTECSFHGKIKLDPSTGKNRCYCDVGWRGHVCNKPGCPGEKEDCTGHGECNTVTHTCNCKPGWTGDPDPLENACDTPDCPGKPDCNNNGTCDATYNPPLCVDCLTGWMGKACEEPCVHGNQTSANSGICKCDSCHTGKGCDSECNNQGACVDGVCQCNDYWKGSKCEDPGCPGDPDCSNHGSCNTGTAVHQCTCNPG